jgi:hypothetical protein
LRTTKPDYAPDRLRRKPKYNYMSGKTGVIRASGGPAVYTATMVGLGLACIAPTVAKQLVR